jgi:hypothetical protein
MKRATYDDSILMVYVDAVFFFDYAVSSKVSTVIISTIMMVMPEFLEVCSVCKNNDSGDLILMSARSRKTTKINCCIHRSSMYIQWYCAGLVSIIAVPQNIVRIRDSLMPTDL